MKPKSIEPSHRANFWLPHTSDPSVQMARSQIKTLPYVAKPRWTHGLKPLSWIFNLLKIHRAEPSSQFLADTGRLWWCAAVSVLTPCIWPFVYLSPNYSETHRNQLIPFRCVLVVIKWVCLKIFLCPTDTPRPMSSTDYIFYFFFTCNALFN